MMKVNLAVHCVLVPGLSCQIMNPVLGAILLEMKIMISVMMKLIIMIMVIMMEMQIMVMEMIISGC